MLFTHSSPFIDEQVYNLLNVFNLDVNEQFIKCMLKHIK